MSHALTNTPIVQKDDYLPFGLSFNSYSRAAITAQNFKFNGGSEVEEMTDWYSTPFRKYDPALGRFHGVDALAEMYTGITPSHFGMNNPVNYNDPTGLYTAPKASDTERGEKHSGGLEGLGSGLGPDNMAYYGRGGSLYSQTWGSMNMRFAALATMRLNHFVNKYGSTLSAGGSNLTIGAISNFVVGTIGGTLSQGKYIFNKWAGKEVSPGNFEGAILNTNTVEGRAFLSSDAYQRQKDQSKRDLINLQDPNAGQQVLDAFRDIYQEYKKNNVSGTVSDTDIIDRSTANYLARNYNMGIITHSGTYMVNGREINMTYTFDPSSKTKYPFTGAPHPRRLSNTTEGEFSGGGMIYRLQWGQVNFNYILEDGNVNSTTRNAGAAYINGLIRYIRGN